MSKAIVNGFIKEEDESSNFLRNSCAMDLSEAIEFMVSGGIVTGDKWEKNSYIKMKNGKIINEYGDGNINVRESDGPFYEYTGSDPVFRCIDCKNHKDINIRILKTNKAPEISNLCEKKSSSLFIKSLIYHKCKNYEKLDILNDGQKVNVKYYHDIDNTKNENTENFSIYR